MTNTQPKEISIVLPAYNEEANLVPLVDEIIAVLQNAYDLEIIIVDDGSKDTTREVIRNLSHKDSRVKGLIFYRNFGHQAALMAGITNASGDAVIIMDSDSQHPPSVLPEMLDMWLKGFDLVLGQKSSDHTASFMTRVFRAIGYKTYSLMNDASIIPGISDFRLMDRNVVDLLVSSNEKRLILRSVVHRYARNTALVNYDVGVRKHGTSSYSFTKLYNLFVTNVVSSSLVPLRLSFLLGIFAITLSIFMILFVLFAKLFLGASIIQGWATTIILLSLYFGLNFFCLGILAEYIGVIFDEVKDRPRFAIKEKISL